MLGEHLNSKLWEQFTKAEFVFSQNQLTIPDVVDKMIRTALYRNDFLHRLLLASQETLHPVDVEAYVDIDVQNDNIFLIIITPECNDWNVLKVIKNDMRSGDVKGYNCIKITDNRALYKIDVSMDVDIPALEEDYV